VYAFLVSAVFTCFLIVRLLLCRKAKQLGYVTTIAGKRRYLPEIASTNDQKRSQAERQAVNTIIQGSASDIIKYAMIDVDSSILSRQPLQSELEATSAVSAVQQSSAPTDVSSASVAHKQHSQGTASSIKLLMQIHDELIFEVPVSSAVSPSSTSAPSCSGIPDLVADPNISSFIIALKTCMETTVGTVLGIAVPLTVKVKVGQSWGSMQQYQA
jgi:hypothetical protein